MLPVARRDTERLRQILSLQRRLLDMESSPRAKRSLLHRPPFQEALVWMEIHGHAPEALEDVDVVEFSPTADFNAVIDHVKAQMG